MERANDDGRLLGYGSLVTDAELDAAVTPWLAGECLVAIDAPLVVTNVRGRRPCEAAISRAFGPQHAGTYPSNTNLPTFSDGGRAAAFAHRHGLDVDATRPIEPGQRRAIEAYPHSATVALFDLPRVLPYKARPGRTLLSRRTALLRLVDLLESLGTPQSRPQLIAPPGTYTAIRQGVSAAPTAAALRRQEDPIDAIVCAYVGLLFLAGSAVVVGDSATGAIVTPVRERHRRLLGLPTFGRPLGGDDDGDLSRIGGSMSLTDDDIVTTRTGANQPVGQAGGDADQSDSDSTQVDPAGVDPSGADHAGGDADQTDADSDADQTDR